MKFGICLPIRRDTSLQFNIDLAMKSEALGFDSVWASDHVVVPDNQVGRFTKYFYDPFVLLTAIAARTEKISLGTSLIVIPYRNPVVVAKMLSTIDVLSGGRIIFGAATGWLREEFENIGVPFEKRGLRTNEYIESIINLWESETPFYEGKYVNFSDISFYPKPQQKPYPPVIIGGNSEHAMKRAALYGNGWQPTWITPGEMKNKIEMVEELRTIGKRDNVEFIYSVRNRTSINAEDDKNPDCYFSGSVEEIAEMVNEYKKAGVSHILFDPECDSDEETFQLIEELAGEFIS